MSVSLIASNVPFDVSARYPHALHHLALLQQPSFREALKDPELRMRLEREQYEHWRTWLVHSPIAPYASTQRFTGEQLKGVLPLRMVIFIHLWKRQILLLQIPLGHLVARALPVLQVHELQLVVRRGRYEPQEQSEHQDLE